MRERQATGRKAALQPPGATAERLHSVAIHLLRRLRREDDASGLGAPRLSALSVVVFGGPVTMGDLARAEQVRVPTMSRLVASLEAERLVTRIVDDDDRRIVRIKVTPKGRALMMEGRRRRVEVLNSAIAELPAASQRLLTQAMPVLERLARGDVPARPATPV